MKYLLMLYADEAATRALEDEPAARLKAAYGTYTQALKDAGAYLGSNRLRPVASARTVRTRAGRRTVVDGPFTEAKEYLGGYYLIEAADEDAAVAWAARCPGAAHGAIEVRPVWEIE